MEVDSNSKGLFTRVTLPLAVFGVINQAARTVMAVVGLGVHYALMAIMVSLFFLVASLVDLVRRQWLLSGSAYGILIYIVMYWIVVPTRFGTIPKTDLWSVGNALFSHIVCVGLPMAFIASRTIGCSPSSASQISLKSASPESP